MSIEFDIIVLYCVIKSSVLY